MVTVNVTESRVSLSVDNRAIKGFVQAQRQQQWSKNGAPRDTWQNRGPIWLLHLQLHTAAWNREKNLSISESFHQYRSYTSCI